MWPTSAVQCSAMNSAQLHRQKGSVGMRVGCARSPRRKQWPGCGCETNTTRTRAESQGSEKGQAYSTPPCECEALAENEIGPCSRRDTWPLRTARLQMSRQYLLPCPIYVGTTEVQRLVSLQTHIAIDLDPVSVFRLFR